MKLLRGGTPFEAAATQYSQDPGSAPRGGDIGLYERDRLPPTMSGPLFSAKVDSILEPFRMNYGYHILKVLSFKGVPTFEEAERDLRTQYQQQRFPAEQTALLQRQRARFTPVVRDSVVNEFIALIDTMRTAAVPGWSDTLTAEMKAKTIMTVGTRAVSVQSFVERIGTDGELRNTILTPANVRMLTQKIADITVLELYARTYTDGNKNFLALMREYEEGILLYRVEQDEVWKKTTMSDSLLRVFHATMQDSYRWPDRVNFAEIFVTSDSAAQAIYKRAMKGGDFLAMAETTTVRPSYRDKKGVWGFQPNTSNELTRKAAELDVDKIAEPYDEAAPEIATAYQEKTSKEREQQWVDELRAKYPVKVNAEVLAKAFSGPAASE
jgi:peptidyl-prolyl cis-trans isomerase SurA